MNKITLAQIVRKIKNQTIVWTDKIDAVNYPIHFIAINNSIDALKSVDEIILHSIIKQQNDDGDTILHIAAKLNFTKLVLYLVNLDLKLLYIKNTLKKTPLYYIINNDTLVKQILFKISLINDYLLVEDCSLLQFYILSNNFEMIYFLLPKINKQNVYIDTLIVIINSQLKQQHKIKLLSELICKENVNNVDSQYLSLLIYSIYANNYTISKLILSKKCDINYSGIEQSDNPLAISIINKNDKITNLLADNNANCEVINKYMQNSLHLMFLSKTSFTTKVKLLKNCTNINVYDYMKNSVLSLMIQYDNWKKYTNILKNHRLKIHKKNRNGLSALDYVKNDDKKMFLEMVYNYFVCNLNLNTNYIDSKINSIAKQITKINKSDKEYIYKYLLNEKNNNKHYTHIKNNKIKFIEPLEVNITHYSSYTYNYFCFLCYLLEKYNKIKIPSNTNNIESLNDLYTSIISEKKYNTPEFKIFRIMIREYINHSPILINHIIIWQNNQNYFISDSLISGIATTLRNFPQTEIVLLKLFIVGIDTNHANMILFNVKQNTVERFDPYGDVAFIDNLEINRFLKKYFKNSLNAQYISPLDTNISKISFQIFSNENNDDNKYVNDPNGFCMAWCIWYVEMKMLNKNIDSKLLITKSIAHINNKNTVFKNYIRNYSHFLDCEKNKILEKCNIPKTWWYIKNLPISLSKQYHLKIRQLFYNLITGL